MLLLPRHKRQRFRRTTRRPRQRHCAPLFSQSGVLVLITFFVVALIVLLQLQSLNQYYELLKSSSLRISDENCNGNDCNIRISARNNENREESAESMMLRPFDLNCTNFDKIHRDGHKTAVTYNDMACAAEAINLKLGERALFPLLFDYVKEEYNQATRKLTTNTPTNTITSSSTSTITRGTTINSKRTKMKQNHNCSICQEIISSYPRIRSLTRIRFDSLIEPSKLSIREGGEFSHPITKPKLSHPEKHPSATITNTISASVPSSLNIPTNSNKNNHRLQVHDAEALLLLAREAFQMKEYWNALSLASLSRYLVHAASPEEQFIQEGGLLYQGIVDYNIYLNAIIQQEHKQEQEQQYEHQQHQQSQTKETTTIKNLESQTDDYDTFLFTLSSCPQHMDTTYKEESMGLEPFYYDSRNADYHELGIIIGMNAYRILPTFESVRQRQYRKKILLDVGANGFYGSPKALLDMYAPYQKFDEIHMFEPDSKGMNNIPEYYTSQYKIKFHQINTMVGTRDGNDILTWMENNLDIDDFVVLKYDVDESSRSEYTMEWGFLADLIHSTAIRLVDEYFTELHFYMPKIGWRHHHHSMRQSYDVFRQLRQCGIAIHSWP